jgi:hypothetical protein
MGIEDLIISVFCGDDAKFMLTGEDVYVRL